MIKERFETQWDQPTTPFDAGRKYTATMRVRIERDGRIASYRLVRSSGLAPMDESLLAAAARVSRIEPLPATLARAGIYEVSLEFELLPGRRH